jgi:hypothetical protein
MGRNYIAGRPTSARSSHNLYSPDGYLISVVMVICNGEPSPVEAMESVLGQLVLGFEPDSYSVERFSPLTG